jgi:tRNA dimethylallyltransferase
VQPAGRSRPRLLPRSLAGDGARDAGQDSRHIAPHDAAPRLTVAPRGRLLVILGPTGTGKSALAVRVAERLDGEIVGCDALQVYRGLDAATAKPTREERARVPHWLVDVADPGRDYSVADYVRDADAAITLIHERGHVPIVAGGTGMYLRGLLKGIVPAPARDEALRSRLRRMAGRFGSPRLHRWLHGLDAASAARVPPRDAQRVVRALELALASGPTWSERLAASGTWARAGERYDTMKFGLDLPREVSNDRLARRVDSFFARGLVGEVDRLLAAGVPATANAFKAIGYREVLRARLEGRDPAAERDAVVQATRRYAKRQRTWFRAEPGVVWLDASRDTDALASDIAAAFRRGREA